MRDVDPVLLDAITGTHQPFMTATAWYDGQVSYQSLPIESCSVSADVDSQIERTLSLVVVSDDPVLSPDSPTSPLCPWGQEINIRAGVRLPTGDVSVSLGWFVIDSTDPQDAWKQYTVNGQTKWALSGLRITVTGKDRASRAADYRFTTTEQKSSGTTAYAEVARLLQHVGTVGEHHVADRALGSIVYEGKERLNALDEVAQRLDARVSWDPEGLAVLVPRTATGDTWTVPTGAKDIVVDVKRKITRGDFHNGVVSEGKDQTTQQPYLGSWTDGAGPQRWGGPAGMVPYFHDSPLITSDEMARQDAATTGVNILRKRQQEITLTCVSNPALELLDEIVWQSPKGEFAGVVNKIKWDHTGTMEVVVLVPQEVIWALR